MMQRHQSILAFAFFTVCATSVLGCDPSDFTASIISGLIQSGGCGSCDCAGCGACDCSSCAGCDCAVDCSPFVRDTAGRAQGFHGVHDVPGSPGAQDRRIPNTIQARLTSSGYAFLTAQIPNVIPAVLPNGIDLQTLPPINSSGIQGTIVGQGSVRLELRNFSLTAETPVTDVRCVGNSVNQYDSNRGTTGRQGYNCTRAGLAAYYKTCDLTGSCTAGEPVDFDIDITSPVALHLDCSLHLDGNGVPTNSDLHDNGLELNADISTIPAEGPTPRRDGYSRVAILDAQADVDTLERQDVSFTCPNNGPYNDAGFLAVGAVAVAIDGISATCRCNAGQILGNCNCDPENSGSCVSLACLSCLATGGPWTCDIDPSVYVDNTIDDLHNDASPANGQDDLNDDIDSLVNNLTAGMLCYTATAPIDCPTGTTHQPSTNTCRIAAAGGVPEHCMETLVGLEARVGLGSALAGISPGIESVVDIVIAAAGNMETAADGANPAGTNLQLFGGIEGWMAGIRALPHNPCVPIEHPANAAADCTALGSGYEYEAIANDVSGTNFSGRCVPKIPLVPIAPAVRGDNLPPEVVPTDDYELGLAVSTSFINYAAWKIWDTGVTCISAGTWVDPLLSPSLLSFALLSKESQPRVFFPLNSDALSGGGPDAVNRTNIALTLRPQTPPALVFDDTAVDPCESGDSFVEIDASLDELLIDMSMWGNDRYQRVGTIATDLEATIRIDLGPQAAGAAGCTAVLASGEAKISLSHLAFVGAHWLPDSSMLAPSDFQPSGGTLQIQNGLDTIGGIAGGIASGLIPSLNLDSTINSALDGAGMGLGGAGLPLGAHFDSNAFQIVETTGAPCQGPPYDMGVRDVDLDDCTHEHFGVYVDLVARTPASPLVGMIDTTVEVTNLQFPADPELYDLQAESFGQGEMPTIEIAMAATGLENAELEYSYRTSYTEWSPWQRSSYALISDTSLLIQGEQKVFARARVVGDSESMDASPGTDSFAVDVTAPLIELYEKNNGTTELQTIDLVSDELTYRVREDGEWSDWAPVPASGIQSIELEADGTVEVRDESGNVGSRGDAIQGRPNAATASGCGCTTVGSSTPVPFTMLLGFGAMLALVMRRRRLPASVR